MSLGMYFWYTAVRSDCRTMPDISYGTPAQARPSKISFSNSGRLRSRSVSSKRSTIVPPLCAAKR
jgi:hypothetical protein